MMNPILGETIYLDFIVSDSGGAAADADSTPTCEVFEDATDTAILSPTVTKRTSKTGNYRIPVACTVGNGFETAKSYNVVVSATVGGVAAKAKVGSFQMRTYTPDTLTALIAAGVTASTVSDKTGYSLSSSQTFNLTGNVTGNLSGSVGTVTGAVGSVTGGVTVTTNNDKSNYVLATTPPTAAAIATQVWSTTVPGSFTSGQSGYALGNVATGTPPTVGAIADAVWDEARSGHTTTGTFGEFVLAKDASGNALAVASTALSSATWTPTRAGYLDALSTSISSQVWSTAVPGSFSSGQAGYVVGTVSTGSPPTAAAIADAVWDEARSGHTTSGTFGGYLDAAISTRSTFDSSTDTVSGAADILDNVVVEVGLNARQALSLIAAGEAGTVTGAGTGAFTITGAGVGTTRMTATTTAAGNRTPTLHPPT